MRNDNKNLSIRLIFKKENNHINLRSVHKVQMKSILISKLDKDLNHKAWINVIDAENKICHQQLIPIEDLRQIEFYDEESKAYKSIPFSPSDTFFVILPYLENIKQVDLFIKEAEQKKAKSDVKISTFSFNLENQIK
jgi:hypothetical protein